MNGIFYVNKSGCQWRMLPSDFAPWQTVYYYFRKWKLGGVWEELLNVLHEANIHDSKGAKPTIENLAYKFPRLSKILADGGYQGDLAAWVKDKFGWELEVVLRPKESYKKFNVIPKRWIVERTFLWLENYRRPTIDYEFLTETAETMVSIAFIQIALNRFF